MKICFLGQKTVGIIGLLTVKSLGHEITAVVSYSDDLAKVVESLDIKQYSNMKSGGFKKAVSECDILLSVHGDKIVPNAMLSHPKIAALNVHPYRYCYKGLDPIGRAIQEKNWNASVECHRMTRVVDEGEVISGVRIQVTPSESRTEIYQQLYMYYSIVVADALRKLEEVIIKDVVCTGWLGY